MERAKVARKLYHIVGSPTLEAFKAMLKSNIIKNCPVTAADVDIAEKIYGPAISTLKGKTTRQTPKPVVADEVMIPSELLMKHRQIELCMDTMFVNKQPFLTSIDKSVRFRSLVPLKSRSGEEYLRALQLIMRHYNKGGFFIQLIHCDGEYKQLIEPVQDKLNATMNFANPGDHVPEAERNNRTIKERIRAAFHRLPYKAMPRVMIRYLSMECTSKLNIFPAKGGISPYYSPRILLNQQTLDYKKECQVPFGAYVQAHNQPTYTNSNAPRTLDAIYLRPAQNMQGGHELMDLTSGLVITRANVTEIPVTDLVIKAVEKMGYDQGFPTTEMKFTNRQGQIYLDNDWIAGVDYDEYEDEEDLEDQEDNENPEDENDDNNEDTDYEEQQQELAEILHEPPEDNPTIDNEEEANEQQEVEVDNEEQQESEHEEDEPDTETEVRRSTRTRKEVDRLNLNIHGIYFTANVERNTQVRRNYTTPHKTQMIDTTINLLVNRTECTNLSGTTLTLRLAVKSDT